VTRVAALVSLAMLVSVGCLAYHAETPLKLEPAPPIPGYERTLVVAVREPEVKVGPSFAEAGRSDAESSAVRVGRATSLIRSLRASGLYREVDFEKQLSCAPDFVLEVYDNPRLGDPDAPWVFLYLGVIPVPFESDTGHYFSRLGEGAEHFEFPWHETLLVGWFMPVLDLFPGWTLRPPPRSQRDDSFRAFLLAHRSELLAGPESATQGSCPSR
jgi:hypothetical protein